MVLLLASGILIVATAMAVLAIDITALYTARSEAQLAADAGALAGARVLANSGITSNPTSTGLSSNLQNIAIAVATQVTTQNAVGGRALRAAEVTVTVSLDHGNGYDPLVTVAVNRSDLPTFFAGILQRMLGLGSSSTTAVTASATAEAYNPSGPNISSGGEPSPVSTTCVKPWILPNLDSSGAIFNVANGAIDTGILGSTEMLQSACGNGTPCSVPTGVGLQPWQYFPGNSDPTDPNASFPAPSTGLPGCSNIGSFNDFQLSIAGCVQQPIACGGTNSNVSLYTSYVPSSTADAEAADAANCLTHADNAGAGGDVLVTSSPPPAPFQFTAGTNNPVVPAAQNVVVSDSLVTIPVANTSGSFWNPVSGDVQIIGFVQLFLNPSGSGAGTTGGVQAIVTNLVECGISSSAQPIYGNGPSAVAVRLIHP